MTQRARCKPLEDGASAHRQRLAQETTPDRALRKMKDKVQKLRTKAAIGPHERIGARALKASTEGAGAAAGQVGSSLPSGLAGH